MLDNAIERREKRKDAQLLREVENGLPHELTDEQRERLIKDFVREQFVRKSMVADVAIHAPGREGDERNHHAHILLTMRELAADGFGEKVRDWNSKEQLEQWRESWENIANRYLEKHGHEAHIDRRTLEEQGIDREPTVHRGPHVDAMEREGAITALGDWSREVVERNATRGDLLAELAVIQKEIRAVESEAYLETFDGKQEVWEAAFFATPVETETASPRVAELRHDDFDNSGAARSETRQPAAINLGPAMHTAKRVLGKALDFAAERVEATLESAATSFESLFETAPRRAPRAPQKPRENPQQADVKADLQRYLADGEYRRALAQREIQERQRRERE